MRWLVFLAGCVWAFAAAAQPIAAPTDADMRRAVSEITEGDPAALAAADAMIAGRAEESFAAEWLDGFRPMAILFHALWETDRLIYLDWKTGRDEALAQFEGLFTTAGLVWPADMAEVVIRQIAEAAPESGPEMAFVYIPLQRLAEQQEHQIMLINDGSDAYPFFLTRRAVAERWADVALGNDMFIDHPDWQFADEMRAAGLDPRNDDHPIYRARPVPPEE
ncbi:hypothetical protein SAMN05421666_2751 [Roseovarius nanhaiticus]|uniref:DUF6630 domain-containing protein n=1 Tax=Roseovarius nanhaiticus TaxID=573024 RepID=A0A1N7HCV5_9RHOB|nr:hypothetical protein [Roseovarius nanhaiticus]SEL02441.1 hypothetical protein SAMN05216208_2564 [Roseovarius nanhaiticus]SIS22603.1 hypothetical protein SAMN05421666_2751 [Roseovarius nanhaiticus]